MTIRYYSSWGDLWFFSLVILGFIILGLVKNGLNSYLYLAIGLGVIYLLWTVILRYRTYLEVRNDRMLTNVGQKSFTTDTVDISAIKNIVRARAFLMKNWGSLMGIYIVNDEGELRQTNLREANYDEETLKDFLSHLKRINPHIELEPLYESLLNGTLPKRLHSIPAEYTPKEIDAQVRQKLGLKD